MFPCNVYNPDPATMASFTALAHVEQNVRGGPSRGEAGLRAPTPGAEPRCWGPPAGIGEDPAGGRESSAVGQPAYKRWLTQEDGQIDQ